MPLFIDHLPLHVWTDQSRTPPLTYWSIALPVLLTEPGLPGPPSGLAPQEWVLDTGNTGEAFAWRHHLVQAGLDPDVRRVPGSIRLAVPGGQSSPVPIREGELWLVSNLPSPQELFHRLQLDRGLPFLDVPTRPDPHYHRPLIGMRALRRARLRIELDLANDAVSVWTPDPVPGTP